ncbi:hypothetical protein CO046_01330 [Candidatus Peregrinibacteria bacterium CG_4_9_14_0_2_um_filter_53_11]|nr:MAG: hypothetical protein CO046_01330 [Candidatus Peregrinibacteria bacterium CG_4_9_14_0_2_um_filter_53_11]
MERQPERSVEKLGARPGTGVAQAPGLPKVDGVATWLDRLAAQLPPEGGRVETRHRHALHNPDGRVGGIDIDNHRRLSTPPMTARPVSDKPAAERAE